ncbi:MAG: helix-turn-helix domain protein [Acidobacteriales bacterium]|nr:helix-turn-helix domain protein [Terriglobales bacterium]
MRRTKFAVVVHDLSGTASDPRIQEAATLLRKRALTPAVQIKEIAANLRMSNSHFRHLFKKNIGIPPAHFVKLIRLQKAKELFATTFLSVKEVMVAAGFADFSHFVRDYKQRFGETPSQSRASARRTQDPSTSRVRNFRQ